MTSSVKSSEVLHPENPLSVFDSFVSSGKPFYAYRLPSRNNINLAVGTIVSPEEYTFQREAFVVAPFPVSGDVKVILPNNIISTPQIQSDFQGEIEVNDSSDPSEEYLCNVSKVIERLKTRGGKSVIARSLSGKTRKTSYARLFHQLCSLYPDFYVYCWTLDGKSLWIGAIPELLLNVEGRNIQSMALAGTKKIDDNADWDEKNKEEQRIVTDYIVEIFQEEGLSPELQGPEELQAGPVKHLSTIISSKLPEDAIVNPIDLAMKLSPTPAVCGFPKAEALKDIADAEKIDREYYGGFSGSVSSQYSAKFYVTLRCMKINILTGDTCLFAGGGITPLSDPVLEWNETRLKASTLLSAFPSVRSI